MTGAKMVEQQMYLLWLRGKANPGDVRSMYVQTTCEANARSLAALSCGDEGRFAWLNNEYTGIRNVTARMRDSVVGREVVQINPEDLE